MFYSNLHAPQLQLWHTRLARVPRWAWIAIFVGIILPLVVLGLGLLAVALASALLLLATIALVVFVRNKIRSLLPPRDDGRRNVRIVVHSARIIDP